MSSADEIPPASAHGALTHPETLPQSETTTYPQTCFPQLEASTTPISRLETVLPDSKSKSSSILELGPSSQFPDISTQYDIAPEELEHQRAIDAVNQMHMFRFDNNKSSASNLPSTSNSQTSTTPVSPSLDFEETVAPPNTEIGGLDDTSSERHDSDASFPSTYFPKGEPATKYFYIIEETQAAQDLERVIRAPSQDYILGLRPKIFFILLVTVVVVITAITVGTILGVQKSKRNHADHIALDPMEKRSSATVYSFPTPTFTSYPLETGPWEIKEPIDVEEGICAPNPQAIDRCDNPYDYKFNILKDSYGFKIQTDLGVLNKKYLYPPKNPDGMYSFNITDWEMESSGELAPTTCKTTVDAYFMLAENYRFHMIFHYKIKKRCELWNGYVAEAGQFCHCEWMGYIYDDFKGPDQITTLKETPSAKLTESLTTIRSSIKSLTTIRSSTNPEPLTIATDSTVVETLTSTPVEALTPTVGKTSIVDATSLTVVKVHSPVNTEGSILTLVTSPQVATATSQ
ncbi:hypothetical protein BGX38DRAFT_1143335 [Terfezia claveryi]|nr:hypothetical protein BGX38DRAFT_1143335 [Terfezia claveryi]